MAGLTNKGLKWEFKNSLWLLYSWIPVAYSAALMYIANRVDYKPFKILANITLFLSIGSVIVMFIALAADSDPLGEGMILLMFLLHILTFVECLILRPKYLKLLAEKEDNRVRDDIAEYVKSQNAPAVVDPEKEAEKVFKAAEKGFFIDESVSERLDKASKAEKTAAKNAPASGKVDINTCTADELAALPGLNLVDGKKAVSHRAETGGYKSVEEFIWFLGIKPHIAAPLHDILVCGSKSENKSENAAEDKKSSAETGQGSVSIKRTIDI